MNKEKLPDNIEALKELVLKQAKEIESNKAEIERSKEEIERSKEEIERSKEEIERSKEEIERSKEEIERSKEEIERSKEEINILREQVEFFKRLKFAPSSEKVSSDQLCLFNEFEVAAEDDEECETDVKGHKRIANRGKRHALPSWLPREEVIVDIPDEDKVCSEDGMALKLIGEEVSEKLDIIPAQIKVIKTIRKKYACPKCDDSIVLAPLANDLLPKSIATPGLIAWIATSKYVDGLPLYRIENVSKRHGIELKRNTMSRWMISVADKLMPLKKILEEELLASDYIHCDETTVQVLKEEGKKATGKSYMWVRGREGPHPIVLFDYSPSRSGSIPKKLFKDYKGYLQTDGYSGYAQFKESENIKLLGCMAHLRRKFYDAWVANKKKKSGVAYLAIEKIKEIYKLEDKTKDLSAEERMKMRQESTKTLVDDFFAWINGLQGKYPAKSLLGTAITYGVNQEKMLKVFLDDGKLCIDNNFIERSIRPFAVGRNAWKFSSTQKGADASALWYSLIETAKLNNVEPNEYLRRILAKLPNAESLEEYLELLPFKIH